MFNDYSSASAVSTSSSYVSSVSVDGLRYAEMIEAEVKLKVIEETVKKDPSKYGLSTETKFVIDAVLGIERKEDE